MSNKSRRRVKIAAGAILAGAAIPIAAAGTAWAQTESVSTLEGQGLTASEATAVYNAENVYPTPVQVSVGGTTVVNDHQGTSPATEATATSGLGAHDVAVAIGPGSDATAGVPGSTAYTNDNAYAYGPGAYADAGVSSSFSSTTTPGGSNDNATDIGSNAGAAPNSHDGAYAVGNYDTVNVFGNNDQVAATNYLDLVTVAGNNLPSETVSMPFHTGP